MTVLAFLGGLVLGMAITCFTIDARIDRITANKIDELTLEDATKILCKIDEYLDGGVSR